MVCHGNGPGWLTSDHCQGFLNAEIHTRPFKFSNCEGVGRRIVVVGSRHILYGNEPYFGILTKRVLNRQLIGFATVVRAESQVSVRIRPRVSVDVFRKLLTSRGSDVCYIDGLDIPVVGVGPVQIDSLILRIKGPNEPLLFWRCYVGFTVLGARLEIKRPVISLSLIHI